MTCGHGERTGMARGCTEGQWHEVRTAGHGRIGVKHARTLVTLEGVDELIVADLDVDLARRVAADVGARAASSIEEAIAEADALVIAASTDAHAELVRAGLARGVPMFCEKPLAADLAGSIAVARELEAAGAAVQLGFQRRFDAWLRRGTSPRRERRARARSTSPGSRDMTRHRHTRATSRLRRALP